MLNPASTKSLEAILAMTPAKPDDLTKGNALLESLRQGLKVDAAQIELYSQKFAAKCAVESDPTMSPLVLALRERLDGLDGRITVTATPVAPATPPAPQGADPATQQPPAPATPPAADPQGQAPAAQQPPAPATPPAPQGQAPAPVSRPTSKVGRAIKVLQEKRLMGPTARERAAEQTAQVAPATTQQPAPAPATAPAVAAPQTTTTAP